MASLMDLIAGYSLPNGLLNMNYKTRNRAGQPVQPSTDTITNAITQGLLPMLASAGIGTGAGIAGQFGDAENLGKLAINKLGGNVNPNTTLPTQEGILSYLNSITPLKPYTDNTYTKIGANLLAPILDPTALITTAKATQNMPIGNMIAYHGTPHEIKGGFDISKVGTGEGAQSYGHGMYFAENPKVAKGYQQTLANRWDKVFVKGEPLNDQMSDVAIAIRDYKSKGGHFATWKNEVANRMEGAAKNGPGAGRPERAQELMDASATIRGLTKADIENTGNLYKVDIPDKHIPNMLDWDKPLREQSDVVRQALGLPEDKFAGFKVPATGTNYSFSPKMTGAEFYKELTDLAKTKAGATEMLNSMGIKGIRYLDEGSRDVPKYSGDIAYIHAGNDFKKHNYTLDDALSGMKQAYKNANVKELKDALNEVYGIKPKQTSNFVVFDPKEVKILEKNNKSIEPTITVNDRNIPVTLHPVEERQGHKIEFVNTNKFENAFKKDETGYIGPLGTENAIKNRYKGVEEFLKTAPSMRASEAYVKPNGSVVFGDGRHRFAYLRDQGLDKIPISMDKESIKNAKKYGYID